MDRFRGTTLHAGIRGLLALGVSLTLVGSVLAAEPAGSFRDEAVRDSRSERSANAERPSRPHARDARGLPFARDRILPRVSLQLGALSAFRHAEADRDIADPALFDEMSRQVRRGVERATRRAVKDYLIDVTELDRLVERLRHRGEGGAAFPEPEPRRKFGFDVGIHRLSPEVEMRYAAGRGVMKLSVDAEGAFGVQYRHNQVARTKVAAGFDGDDTYRLQLHVDF